MKKLTTYKIFFNYSFLAIITFLIWASVGSKFISLSNTDDINIKFLINNLRFFLPIILIIALIYFNQNYQKNTNLNVIIFAIFISFIIGNYNLYNNNNDLIQIFNNNELLIKFGYRTNFFRDLMMSFFFISVYLIYSRLDQTQTQTVLILNFVFISLISFITLYFSYLEYFSIKNDKEYLYFTQFLVTGELYGVPTIRSLGLSRNLLIILIPIAIFSLFGKTKKYNIYLNIFIIVLCLNIYQLQSRLTIYSFLIFSFLILLYFTFKKKIKKVIYFVFIFLIIPQFLNFLVPNIKKYYFENNQRYYFENNQRYYFENNKEILINDQKGLSVIVDFIKKLEISKGRVFTRTPNNPQIITQSNDEKYNAILAKEFSSGRTELWKNTLKIFTNSNDYKNLMFGFGTSADRYFLKESASSAFFYSLISGGLLGLLFLIMFYLYLLNLIYFFLVNIKKIENKIMIYSVITIIIFIMLRSLVESSFLVFGTDNIFLFSCLFYLQNKKNI